MTNQPNTHPNGRMFVCGDIHGCLHELLAKLKELGFDRSRDHLYALGDLVDRGPNSAEVIRLLDEPWFDSIMGNHEVMMLEAAEGNSDMHRTNGGEWFSLLNGFERALLVARVVNLPIALTLTSPSGRRIGIAHADMPGADWDRFIADLGSKLAQDYALWARSRVQELKRGVTLSPIKGVDHVYFGHTPLTEPLRAANMSWIDTGCYKTGRITVEEVL